MKTKQVGQFVPDPDRSVHQSEFPINIDVTSNSLVKVYAADDLAYRLNSGPLFPIVKETETLINTSNNKTVLLTVENANETAPYIYIQVM